MKKRLLSLLLVLVTALGIFPAAALAASSEAEALGEIDIYNGGYKMTTSPSMAVSGNRTIPTITMNHPPAKSRKFPPTVSIPISRVCRRP